MQYLKSTLVACALLATTLLSAQKYTVTGTVQDSTDQPLIGGTVVFLNPADSVMAGFGITDGDGSFAIDKVPGGTYNMQITYIGYGTFQNVITVEGEEKKIDIGTIKLAGNENMLDAVEITGRFIPIVVKKDTVEYNADAYRVRPNATVEELLKKMPGIEVDNEGNITAQGEEVNKVTVDGKSFFGTDPKAATKNLPADAIKKVQVIDEKSKSTQFTGVDDGNESKTINLELKEDKKKGYFGNATVGYGTENRNNSKLSINSFNKKLQLSGIVGYNNINENGFSFSDYESLMGGDAFRGGRFNSPIDINWGDRGYGDSRNLSGGLNMNYDLGKKKNISASYYLVNTDNNVFNSRLTENALGARQFIQQDTSMSTTDSRQHVFSTSTELQFDSLQRLDLTLGVTVRQTDASGDGLVDISSLDNALVTSTATENVNKNNTINFRGEADYNLRLGKPGRVFTMSGSYGLTETEDSLDIYQEIVDPLEARELLLAQYQLDTTENNNFRVNFNYKEPIAKDQYIDLGYTRRNFKTYRLRDFIDQDLGSRLQDLSSATDNNTDFDDYRIAYTLDKPAYLITGGLTLHRSFIGSESFEFQEGTDLLVKNDQLSLEPRTFNAVLPQLTVRVLDKALRLRYEAELDEPDVQDLQTIVDNTDPNRITLGNPNLNPEYVHNVSLRYNKFDRFTFRSIFGSLRYTYTEDNIIDSISVDDRFVQVRQPINGSGSHRVSGWLSVGSPVKPLYFKTRLSVDGGVTIAENFINNERDNVRRWSPSTRIEFENLNNDHFTLVLSGRLGWNNNSFENNPDFNNSIATRQVGSELIVDFGKGWSLDTDISSTHYYNDGKKFNDYTLWNAEVSKTLFDDRLTIGLRAFDLLDQNRGIDVNQTATSLSQSFSNTLERYFMLNLGYKFSSLGGAGGGGGGSRVIIRG